jgi:hypothetical protein
MDFSILTDFVSLVRQSNETPAETKLSDFKVFCESAEDSVSDHFGLVFDWFHWF